MPTGRLTPVVLVWLMILACAPGALPPAADQPASARASSPGPAVPKQLVAGILSEPKQFAPWGSGTTAGGLWEIPELVRRTLTVVNDHGVPQAELAAALPTLENGDWRINPDGSMAQTWRIRPEARWHDGHPVTADDFVFGWELFAHPTLPISDPNRTIISSATAADPATLVLHFTVISPAAAQALFDPYPRHLLAAAWDSGDLDRFMGDEYWTTDFVGTGPFRLTSWVLGSHMEFGAFADYLGGRPKLDRIIVRFLQDPNTLLANLASDQIDVALPDAVSVEMALTLQQSWAAPGTGNNVILYPDGRLYWIEFQQRAEYQKPTGGRDPRLRAALYQAIDKAGVIEVELAGLGPQADSWITADDPNRAQFASAIPAWAYQPAVAQRMLAEAGWQRAADGVLTDSATGERLDLDLRVTNVAGHVKALSVMADNWRQVGATVSETVIPPSRNNDGEYRSTFPFANLTGNWVSLDWETGHFSCATVARPANRWSGAANRAGYCNAAHESVIEQLRVTIPDQERAPLRAAIMRQVFATEYARLPLYWQVQPIPFAKNVQGFSVLQSTPLGHARTTWNAHRWDKQ
jgi:peptide/nickel transport system substrate-binding protein